ncbi:MAG: aminotransferase class V-fold PLP-dependent enzyme [Myxococcales bacterium]|nr:aminotransferase class V-fold PLP-dependent enzyme [Myxococcales bacterium]
MTLDLTFVRSQFPAFRQPTLEGSRHFENAGGSYACRHTIERLTRFYTQTKLQPYPHYAAGQAGGAQMQDARERLAGLLNVQTEELHAGPSTTQNVYVLARAFRAGWREGDEIIVTDQDHEANIGAWRRLADTGIVVREWSADQHTGQLDPAALDALLTERTRLVAFTHCSNVVAHHNPVAAITAKVRAAGARSVVDGVAYAPHGLPDVTALGADVYLFSAYKTYGPHQGVMVVRQAVMDTLANQSHDFNDGVLSKRLVPAGPDHAQVAALGGVADYLHALHDHHFPDDASPAERGRRTHQLMEAHERALLAPLLERLAAHPAARVLGPTDAAHRAPTVACDTTKAPESLARALAERGIMAAWGHFYAPRILRRMGVDPNRGVLRLSFTHYTSHEDVQALIDALDAVL